MTWLARSDPAEHFECHLGWEFSAAGYKGQAVCTLVDKRMTAALSLLKRKDPEFEVTFMVVEDSDLRRLFSKKGIRRETVQGKLVMQG